jgi:hypothetical protein
VKNEVFMEIPIEVIRKAEELGCLKTYDRFDRVYVYKYVYKKGNYGGKFPASCIGGTKATRFGNWESVAANEVDLGMGWVVFSSPTHGGVNIFGDWIPYRH